MKKLLITLACAMVGLTLQAQFLIHQHNAASQGTALKTGFVFDAAKNTWSLNGIDVASIDSVTVAKDISQQLSQETILKENVYRLAVDNNDYSSLIDRVENGIFYFKNSPALAQRKLLQVPKRVATRNSRGVVADTTVWETAPIQTLSQVTKGGYIIIPAAKMSDKEFFDLALKEDVLSVEQKLRLYGGCYKVADNQTQVGAGSVAAQPVSIYEACKEVSIKVEEKEFNLFDLLVAANIKGTKKIDLPLTKLEDDYLEVETSIDHNKREVAFSLYYVRGEEEKMDLEDFKKTSQNDRYTASTEHKRFIGVVLTTKLGDQYTTKVGYDIRSSKNDNKISYIKSSIEAACEFSCKLELGGEIELETLLGREWKEKGKKILPSIPIPGLSVDAGIGGVRLGAFIDTRFFFSGSASGIVSFNLFTAKPTFNYDIIYDHSAGLRSVQRGKRDFQLDFPNSIEGEAKAEIEAALGIGPVVRMDAFGMENKFDLLFGVRGGAELGIGYSSNDGGGVSFQAFIGGLLRPSLNLADVIKIERNFLEDYTWHFPEERIKSLPRNASLVRGIDNNFELTVPHLDRLVWLDTAEERYKFRLAELKNKQAPPLMRTLQLTIRPLETAAHVNKDTLYLLRISPHDITTIDTLVVTLHEAYLFKDSTGTRNLKQALPVKVGQRNKFLLYVHPTLKQETPWWQWIVNKKRFTATPSDERIKIVSIKRTSEYEHISWEQHWVELDIPKQLPQDAKIHFKDEFSGHSFEIRLEETLPVSITHGLNAYYPFDYNAEDASGNGLHGTAVGATHVREHNNGYYVFDGVDDYIEVPPSPLHSRLEEATISAWVLIDEYYTSTDGTKWFNLLCHSQINTSIRGPWSIQFRPGELPEKEWIHIAYSYGQGYNATVYINGEPQNHWWNGISNSSYYQDSNLELLIGANPPGLPEFNKGKMDEIYIYNRQLNAEEVQLLYKAGIAKGLGVSSHL